MKKRQFVSLISWVALALLSTCMDPVDIFNGEVSTEKEITEFVFKASNNTSLGEDARGDIKGTDIKVTVPYGTDLTSLAPTVTVTGVIVNPASGVAKDFGNGSVTYTIVAANWSTQEYTVTVEPAPYTPREITSFVFRADVNNSLNADVEGDVSGSVITATVPYDTDVTSLTPTVTTTGVAVTPASEETKNFTDLVKYTVAAEGGGRKEYAVIVTKAGRTEKEITSFVFKTDNNPVVLDVDAEGTINGTAITAVVPYGTNVTSLMPTIAIRGTSVSPAGSLAKDFTDPVTYTVTAADGSTEVYTVTVVEADITEKEITHFVFKADDNAGILDDDVEAEIDGTTITAAVPYGTVVKSLSPTITIKGADVTPVSGKGQDFTRPVSYTVTAGDGSTEVYTVTVTETGNTEKEIVEFTFLADDNDELDADIEAEINGTVITATVPHGTDVTSLTPTITITGESVSPASGDEWDFTDPATYTVTAEDGTTKEYRVAIIEAGSEEKTVTHFVFKADDNDELDADVEAEINGTAITATVPYGTDISSLVPTITIIGKNITPADGEEKDFTEPVTYTVTAADNSTKNFTVIVTKAANTEKEITSFIFEAVNNIGVLDSSVEAEIEGTAITAIVPYGTVVTSLTPTITIKGAGITPADGEEKDFTKQVFYIVVAADGSTENYRVDVVEEANSEKEITSFVFEADEKNSTLRTSVEAEINGTAITAIVPFGTDVTSLIPTIEVSNKAAVTPASGEEKNFIDPVTYTVTAEDESEETYTVTVTEADSTEKEIVEFTFLADDNDALDVDIEAEINGTTIIATVPFGTVVTSLMPTIEVSERAVVTPESGEKRNFASPVTYTVTAEDESEETYTVIVTREANIDKDITHFVFEADVNDALDVDVEAEINGTAITAIVPFGTDVTSLTPTVTMTGQVLIPASGEEKDFTDPIDYAVVAEDGSRNDYTVTVTEEAGGTEKEIISFVFEADDNDALDADVEAEINGTAITATVPFGTVVTALTPTIIITGESLAPGSGEERDFTDPITYRVTAEDSSEKEYTVTVTIAGRTEKEIRSFVFEADDNDALDVGVEAQINGTDITASVPYGTVVTSLRPTITIIGAGISPASGEEKDFTDPITYTVTAEDGSEEEYTVTVVEADRTEKEITLFSFHIDDDRIRGIINGTAITVSVPYGTDITSLAPEIEIAGESITPASGDEQDFTNPVTYTVTAEDGSTKDFTIIVTEAANTDKVITSFVFEEVNNTDVLSSDVEANIDGTTITASLPYGTDVSSLIPTITITGKSIAPESGIARDFTSPVAYTVIAEDWSTAVYAVTLETITLNVSSYYDDYPRIGAGDFEKPDLFEIGGLSDGDYSYSLTIAGREAGSDTVTVEEGLGTIGSDLDVSDWSLIPDGDIAVELVIVGNTLNYNTIKEQYKIRSWHDLQGIEYDLAGDYILMNDIEMPDPSIDGLPSEGFNPIGGSSASFTGSFDGQDKVVSNFFIERSSDYVGLFGYVENAEISNVGIETSEDGISGNSNVGGLVGLAISNSTIGNSYVTGSVTGSDAGVGGLVGTIFNSGTITNSYATADITGTESDVGGLVGAVGSQSPGDEVNIYRSYSVGSVEGRSNVGGFVGRFFKGTIEDSYATGSVTGTSQYAGGLFGRAYYSEAHIVNSYAAGKVVGVQYVGGLGGEQGESTVANSYWDKVGTEQEVSSGGTGVSSEAALERYAGAYYDTGQDPDVEVFVNWDFGADDDTPWIWPGDSNWPILYWQDSGIVPPAASTAKDIESFVFEADNNDALDIDVEADISGTTITASVPYGADASSLIPTIEVSYKAAVTPSSGEAWDFADQVPYTVTAEDGSTQVYTVTVTENASSDKDIESFVFEEANNTDVLDGDVEADIDGTAITAIVPYGTDISSLIPTITITGESVSPASGGAEDFTSPVPYTVTAEDNTTKVYTVTVESVTLNVSSYYDDYNRIGAGDFEKPDLFEIGGLSDGDYSYSLTIAGQEAGSGTVTVGEGTATIGSGLPTISWSLIDDDDIAIALTIEGNTLNYSTTKEQYSIRSWQDLQGVEYDLAGDYILMNDIEMPEPSVDGLPLEGFNPIGRSGDDRFTGTFDGQGSVISNFFIEIDGNNVGLFGRTDGAEISNIGIETSSVKGRRYVGGLVGFSSTGTTIINSYVTGSIEGTDNTSGGLVGEAFEGTTIRDSYATADVTGVNFVGGLAGFIGESVITNSYATGSVTGTGNDVGGLVGSVNSSTTDNSYWDIASTGQNSSAGSEVGVSSEASLERYGGAYYDTGQEPDVEVFVNWDFGADSDNPWVWLGDSSWPSLYWQGFTAVPPISDKDIESFVFEADNNDALDSDVEADISGTTITASVPYGADITSLIPTIEVSHKAAVTPSSGEAWDFTDEATYTVTAEDGSTQVYTVTVAEAANTAKDIESFVFEEVNNTDVLDVDVEADIDGTAITVTVPYGTDITSLIPTIEVSERASVAPASGEAEDFTNQVPYTVTAEDQSTQVYTVTIEAITLNVSSYYDNYNRIGAGDLEKPDLFEIGGLSDGDYSYSLTIAGWEAGNDIVTVEEGLGTIGSSLDVSDWSLIPDGDIAIELTIDGTTLNYNTTKKEQYKIRSWQDLQGVKYDLSGDYILVNDIEMPAPSQTGGDFPIELPLEGFNPVGDDNSEFTGTFDGQDKVVSNFFIERDRNNVGLFGRTEGAEISNIGIETSSVKGKKYVGGLVGFSSTGTTIINSYVTGSIEGTDNTVGGLVGEAFDGTTIRDSYATADVTGAHSVGGLAGFVGESAITNSFAGEGIVSGANSVGGLAGSIRESVITNSFATGSVPETGNDIGGLVGSVNSSTTDNSYWDMTSTGKNSSAGSEVGVSSWVNLERYGGAYYDTGQEPDVEVFVDWGFGTDSDNPWVWLGDSNWPSLYWQGLTAVPPISDKDIESFVFEADNNDALDVDVEADISGTTITALVPYGADITLLIPTIEVSYKAAVTPSSGEAWDFADQVPYTVTAEDGSTQVYTVTVTEDASSDKDIESFVFEEANNADVLDGDVEADIDGTAITVTVPYGTDVSSLIPTITITGESVSPASGEAEDFTSPVPYTVTAEDQSTQVYTVTVESVTLNVSSYYDDYNRIGAGDLEKPDLFEIGGLSDGDYSYSLTIAGQEAGSGTVTVGEGLGTIGSGLPTASWSLIDDGNITIALTIEGNTLNYSTTKEQYSIRGWHDLQGIGYDLAGDYILINNIEMPDPSVDGLPLEGFNPVGDDNSGFTGTFDGQGKVVSNFFIERDRNNVGLFGRTTEGAEISNIGIETSSVKGKKYVGGLVGFSSTGTTIINSYVTGSIEGTDNSVGGLVGETFGGTTIRDSYATADVTGAHSVGGLAGFVRESAITNSYAVEGIVSGANSVGGLVGEAISSTTITNSFATGSVPETGNDIGGLVGSVNSSTTDNSYWDMTSTGKNSSAGSEVGVSSWGNLERYGGAYYDTGQEPDVEVFVDWGFGTDSDNPWVWLGDSSWPTLYWQGLTAVPPISDKDIESFVFEADNNDALDVDVEADISGTTITALVPYGADITLLIPTIEVSYKAAVTPSSGEAWDFADQVPYTVTAEDGSTQVYTVTVTEAASSDKDIESFVFEEANNTDVLDGDVEADIDGTAITVTVPYGTDISSLIPTITITGESVSPASGEAEDFTSPVPYTVTAEDQSTQVYTVTVEAVAFYVSSYYDGYDRIGAGDLEKPDLFEIGGLSDGDYSYSLTIAGQEAGSGTVTVGEGLGTIGSELPTASWSLIGDGNIAIELTIEGNTLNYSTTKEQYSIRGWHDLQGMEYNLAGDYTLMNDIALPDPSVDGLPLEGFNPVGDSFRRFTGSFDGDNYKISNFFINREGTNNVGLFSYADGLEIRDVGIEISAGGVTGRNQVGSLVGFLGNSTITNSYATGNVTGRDKVGSLVGSVDNSTITNSYATGGETTGRDWVGGLVGYILDSTVTDSYATGGVTGESEIVGSLVGFLGNSTITNSYATGNVTGSYNVGGLVGYILDSTVTDSYATGSVEGTNENVGGLVGKVGTDAVGDSDTGTVGVYRSYATGNVEGDKRIGGLAGNIYRGTIEDSYATGSVEGYSIVGGLVGIADNTNAGSGRIVNSYATGSVTAGDDDVGGLVGSEKENAGITATSSYWDIASTGQDSSIRGTSISSGLNLELYEGRYYDIDSNVFVNWDFGTNSDNPWVWLGDSNWPILYWQDLDTVTPIPSNKKDIKRFVFEAGSETVNGGILDDVEGVINGTDITIVIPYWTNISSLTPTIELSHKAAVTPSSGVAEDFTDSVIYTVRAEDGTVRDYTVTVEAVAFYASSYYDGYDRIGAGDLRKPDLFVIGGLADGDYSYSLTIASQNAGSGTVTVEEGSGAIGIGSELSASDWSLIPDGDDITIALTIEGETLGNITTKKEQYSIRSWQDLQGIEYNLAGDYTLINNIELPAPSQTGGDFPDELPSEGFNPIGDDNSRFTGTFDGQDKVISNFFIERSRDYVGLFGYTDGAEINNVGIEISADGVTGDNRVGSLAGFMRESTITNSYATGGSVAGVEEFEAIGGLAGEVSTDSVIRDSYTTVEVTGYNRVGGLAGRVEDYSTITNSYATGDVTGYIRVGGLAGRSSYSTVTNSYTTGSVEGDSRVGGLIGYSEWAVDINSNYATGNVTGDDRLGGLLGTTFRSTITNNYATGDVAGRSHVGGLIAYSNGDTVTNNYATGRVTGTESHVGGLIGRFINSTTTTDSYWDIVSTGQNSSIRGTGISSGLNLELYEGRYYDIDSDVFVNWDFGTDSDNPWVWLGDSNWPILYWQDASEISPIPSNRKDIKRFVFTAGDNGGLNSDVEGVINGENIEVTVPYGASVASLIPTIELSHKAAVSPASGQERDFRDEVTYTVTAEDNTTKVYTVSVEGVALNTSSYYLGENRIGAGDFEKPDLFEIEGLPDGSYSYSLIIAGQEAGSDTVTVAGGSAIIGSTLSPSDWSLIPDGTVVIDLTIDGQEYRYRKTKEQYSIRGWQDLQGMEYNLAGDYTLMNDIALPDPSVDGLPLEGFNPIGDNNSGFTGSFDGQGRIISNFFIERSSDNVGLFGRTEGAEISNVGIEISAGGVTGRDKVGSLVGSAGNSTITNSYATGSVTATRSNVGGLVGEATDTTIADSYATGNITTTNFFVGGLLGTGTGGVTITKSYATGSVTGGENGKWHAGGLVGAMLGSGSAIISSYATGDVTGMKYDLGGLVGIASNDTTITNSYATGDVAQGDGSGGLVGRGVPTIINSYATGRVSGISTDIGGLVGKLNDNNDPSTVINSYWDIASTGQNSSIRGTGISSGLNLELYEGRYYDIDSDVFVDWDFGTNNDNPWVWLGDSNWPILYWQDASEISPIPSNRKDIKRFVFTAGDNGGLNSDVEGVINGENIEVTVPYGASVASLTPTIELPHKAAVSPASGQEQDFRDEVTYTVTAEDNTTKVYTVSVEGVALNTSSYYLGENRIGAGDFEKPDLFEIEGLPDGSYSYSLIIAGQEAGSDTVTVAGGSAIIGSTLSPSDWSLIPDGTVVIDLTIDGQEYRYRKTKEQYSIRGWQDLQGMEYNLAGDYTLMNDIALPDPSVDGLPLEGFNPIGDDNSGFTGSFDGQGRIISNFFINREVTENIGLFGYADGVEIRDVGIEISAGGVTGGHKVGGLVGHIRNNSTITNSYTTGSVTAIRSNVGGLVGEATDTTIADSYATGNITATNFFVGGLLGTGTDGVTITKSYATGSVTGGGGGKWHAGGLVGAMLGSGSAIISSYATGDVTGMTYDLGGLVGTASSDTTITNSYATGDVAQGNGSGGLVGRGAPTIINSYATGRVSGTSINIGGLVGKLNDNNDPPTVINSYWDIASTGQDSSRGSEVGVSSAANLVEVGDQYYDTGPNPDVEVFIDWNFGTDSDNPWEWIGDGEWPIL